MLWGRYSDRVFRKGDKNPGLTFFDDAVAPIGTDGWREATRAFLDGCTLVHPKNGAVLLGSGENGEPKETVEDFLDDP